jgi:hypothetical protein
MYPACAKNAGDRVVAKSVAIVFCVRFLLVTAEGVVAKYIVVMVSACATCVWWINWEA